MLMATAAEADLTPLGQLLERHRGSMSKREAARRAGISEGRWRQVVTGRQKSGAVSIPVNPRRQTVIAMARAVGADRGAALDAAGFDPQSHDEDEVPAGVVSAIRDDPVLPERVKDAMIVLAERYYPPR